MTIENKLDGPSRPGGFLIRWRERRMASRIKRISRKLDLDDHQQVELAKTLASLRDTRRQLHHWQSDIRRQLATILRNPETHADALKTEIDLGMEALQAELNSASGKLVSLVGQLNNQQRSKLAEMMNHRSPHCARHRAAAN